MIGAARDHLYRDIDVALALAGAQNESRGTRPALPADIHFFLNDVQRIALSSLDNFGWKLAFIRRPLFSPPLVVVKNSSKGKLAILEEDGSVNLSPQIKWRH